MKYVLINPITKKPASFEPGEGTPMITSGPYQNVAEVSEEYIAAERARIRAAAAEGGEGGEMPAGPMIMCPRCLQQAWEMLELRVQAVTVFRCTVCGDEIGLRLERAEEGGASELFGLTRQALDYLYNAFEPDNQSELYKRLNADYERLTRGFFMIRGRLP